MAELGKTYNTDEKTYQIAFYESLFDEDEIDTVLHLDRNTDGYTDGILFEHKLNVTSAGQGKVLSQALLYLVKFNASGQPIPAKIMLVSQDEETIYLYNTEDYIDIVNNIAKYGGFRASVGIDGFIPNTKPKIINYNLKSNRSMSNLRDIIDSYTDYAKVNICLENVYGWSCYYYKNAESNCQKAEKKAFFNELKEPQGTLKSVINKWVGDETEFGVLMDLLNDSLTQKNLGAFYTPEQYCQLGAELLRKAIAKVPDDNDYVIIDRCAGVGNLEDILTEDELKHVIISTYELKEWFVLYSKFGVNKRVRAIIPEMPKEDGKMPELNEYGFLKGANALEEGYVEKIEELIEKTRDKSKKGITRIIYENPPYAETTSIEHQKIKQGKTSSEWKNSLLVKKMKQHVKDDYEISSKATNDIGNVFIWTGFEYLLKEPSDCMVVYSPVKYWKAQHLIKKQFEAGYAINRKHFHASSDACIMLALWKNTESEITQIRLPAYNIDNKGNLYNDGEVFVKQINSSYSQYYYDKRKIDSDLNDGVLCEKNGKEVHKVHKQSIQPKYNKDIIGYMVAQASGFDNASNAVFTRCGVYNGHGFFLRSDNFIEKLPMFVASKYMENIKNWKEMSMIMKSADGRENYESDVKNGVLNDFLCKCLIYTGLTSLSKIRSFNGSDGRLYLNELCFDGSDTLASRTLKQFVDNGYQFTVEEQDLFNDWKVIIDRVKLRRNDGSYKYPYDPNTQQGYNPKFKYGLYQIDDEVNYQIDGKLDRKGKPTKIYNDGDLNALIKSFKKKLKAYYLNNLVDTLFEYEFLK